MLANRNAFEDIFNFQREDRIGSKHRHGLLELTLPLRDSVKPRRIQIEGVTESQKQLTTT